MGLHTELYALVFLSSDNRSDIGLGQGDDPVVKLFGWVGLKKLLLGKYFFDGLQIVALPDAELYFRVVVQRVL